MKNVYWNLEVFESMRDDEEEYIFNKINHGQKTQINLHIHPINDIKYPLLIVGNEYFIQINMFDLKNEYKRCKINLIRSGIVFYTIIGYDTEFWFQEFSITHQFMEPVEMTVNLNPKYYEIVSSSGQMKVNYLKS